MADLSKQYPRMYQPGVMVGEDIDPRTGQPLSTYHPLMTPGVMVGEDIDPGISSKPMPMMTPGVMVGEDQIVPKGQTFYSEASRKGSSNQLYGPGGSPTGSGQGQARQGNRPFIASPYIDGTEYRPTPGSYRGFGQRYQADKDGIYREVNIVQPGQPATLNGQAVRADGKGNWIGFGGRVVGTYELGKNRTPINPKSTKTQTTFKNITESTKPKPKPKPEPETLKTEKPLADDAQLQPETILTQELRNSLAPDGSNSQGTRTSPSPLKMKDVNDLLALQGIRKFTPNQEFNSNQLPTTSGSPYGSISEDAQVMGMSKEDSQLIESGGKVETVFKDGVESSRQIFKDPGSRAFLDYEGTGGSMGAFRAAERARGMITLQGKTYIPNPLAGQDGQEEFQLISQDQRNDVNSGRITAQDLASSYINRINGANADFSAQDYQTMGGNKANVPTMSNAGSVEVDIDADFDYENPTEVRRGMVF